MIDEIEIKQKLMLLEAEYNYLWSHSYSNLNPPFCSKRSTGFTEIKHMIRYYKKLETKIRERNSIISSITTLECLKTNSEFKILASAEMTEIEQDNYHKICKDLSRLQNRLKVLNEEILI